jgi:hypothetical protein
MCPATMFGFRVLLCNGRFTDPFGVTRSLILMWHPAGGNEFWSIASQNLELTNIGCYEQDSIITPYGTDGTSLYQLFAIPDPTLLKQLSTKYLRGKPGLSEITIKNWKRLFLEVYDNTGDPPFPLDAEGERPYPIPAGVEFTGNLICSSGGVPGGVQDIGFALTEGSRYAFEPQAVEGGGIAATVDLFSTSPDFTIERLHILSEDRTLWGA